MCTPANPRPFSLSLSHTRTHAHLQKKIANQNSKRKIYYGRDAHMLHQRLHDETPICQRPNDENRRKARVKTVEI